MTASSPVAPAAPCPSRERPVDLIHLARQTGGSHQLEGEVLTLMARHIATALDQSEDAGRCDVVQLAHAMTGAARNLGAFPLARAAQALETQPGDASILDSFRGELRRTLAFIDDLGGKRGRVDASPRAH